MNRAAQRLLPLSMLVLLSAGPAGRADDWPQFKGDAERTGDRPGEALELPLRRVTAVRFPAPIYASPAVAGGRVYVQDSRGNVACVEGNRAAWTTSLGGVANHSSPAVAEGKVFVGSTAGFLAILDAADGRVLRKVPAEGGVVAAPAVANGAVYFPTVKGQLFKIDPAGAVQWTLAVAPALHVEIAVRGDLIVALSDRAHVIKDEGKSARELHRSKELTGGIPVGGPVFVNATAVLCQGYDSEFGTLSEISWAGDKVVNTARVRDSVDSRVTLSVREGVAYRGDVAMARGGKTRRLAERSLLPAGAFHSSPALSAKHLIVGTEKGEVHFIPLAGGGPEWTFQTEGAGRSANGAVSSSPAVAPGKVYFGGEDGILYGLGSGSAVDVVDLKPSAAAAPSGRAASGPEWHSAGGDMGFSGVARDQGIRPPYRVRWKTRIWGPFKSPVIVAEGKVFAAGRLGELTALDAENGDILWRSHHPFGESRGAPTYADGKVVVLRGSVDQDAKPNTHGGLWVHAADSGTLLWRKELPIGYLFNTDGAPIEKGKVFVCWNAGEGAVEAAAFRLSDGTVVWRKKYENLVPVKEPALVRPACAVGGGRAYFGVIASETLSLKKSFAEPFGATVAVDPESGSLLWANTDHSLVRGSRISYRAETLCVFGADGSHALDAKTGKHLWTVQAPKNLYFGHYYWQPLTDTFLGSQGRKGACGFIGCSSPIFVDGLWHGHDGSSTNHLIAFKEASAAGNGPFKPEVVWKYTFLSNACPPPAPAYGRLYYSPNGEGVVYCFEPGKE